MDTLGARATAEDALFTGKVAMRWTADSGLSSMEENAGDVEWATAPIPYPEGVEGGQMLTWLPATMIRVPLCPARAR